MDHDPADDEREDPALLHEVYLAMKHMGWLLPITVAEVREAERQIDLESYPVISQRSSTSPLSE